MPNPSGSPAISFLGWIKAEKIGRILVKLFSLFYRAPEARPLCMLSMHSPTELYPKLSGVGDRVFLHRQDWPWSSSSCIHTHWDYSEYHHTTFWIYLHKGWQDPGQKTKADLFLAWVQACLPNGGHRSQFSGSENGMGSFQETPTETEGQLAWQARQTQQQHPRDLCQCLIQCQTEWHDKILSTTKKIRQWAGQMA